MPTVIATPSNVNTKIRFAEQYVSEGLNKKSVGAIPNGIIRGAKLVTTGAGLNVQIEPDPNTGDSIYTYTTPTGFQLTHREAGIRVLNMTPVASTVVYVCLYIQYAIGSPTIVEWRTYTEAELFGGAPVAEAGSVVVVGKVDVPGAGPIPAGNVTRDRARFAWADAAAGMRPWKQLVQNGSFDAGVDSSGGGEFGIPHWRIQTLGGTPALDATATSPRSGLRSLEWTGSGATDHSFIGPGAAFAGTPLSYPIIPVYEGQILHGSFWVAGSTIPAYTAGIGGVALIFTFYDEAGSVIDTVRVETDPTTEVGTFAYRQIEALAIAPADCLVGWHLELRLDLAGGPGSFYVDDIRVFLQPHGDTAKEDQGERGAAADDGVFTKKMTLLPSLGAASLTDQHDLRVDTVVLPVGGVSHIAHLLASGFGAPFVAPIKSNNPDNEVPRFTTDTTGAHVLIWESTYEGSKKLRLYSRGTTPDNGGLEITVNAAWDVGTSMWVADDTSKDAQRFSVREDVLLMERMPAPIGGPWSDTGWTAATVIGSSLDVSGFLPADIPLLGSDRAPGDHPGFPVNTWKLIGRFKTSGIFGYYVRLYAGSVLGLNALCALTLNARWDVATSMWVADSVGGPAIRLKMEGISGSIASIDSKLVTAAPWAEAGWDAGGALGQAELDVGYLYSRDDVYALGDVISGSGDIYSDNSFFANNGGYRYLTPLVFNKFIPLTKMLNAFFAGSPSTDYWKFDGVTSGNLTAVGSNPHAVFPIELPSGASITDIDTSVNPAGASAMGVALGRAQRSFGGGTTLTYPWGNSTSSGAGQQTVSVSGAAETIDNDLYEYFVIILSGQAGDVIETVRMTFNDVGLNNG